MRNSIDKDTYGFLFGILAFFTIILAILTTLFYIDLKGFDPKILKISSFLLSLVVGVTLWVRVDYYKTYNAKIYKLSRIPMWFSAGLFLIFGVFILV
jgi:xanthine/uracil permease